MTTRVSFLLIVATLAGSLASSAAEAQEHVSLEHGDLIEVVSLALPGGVAVGWLTAISKDSIAFLDSAGTGTIILPLDTVGQIQKNIGRDGAARNVITVMGAVTGAALATTFTEEDPRCRFGTAREDECGSEVPVSIVGLLIGGGIARLLSQSLLEERWVRVPLDPWLEAAAAARAAQVPRP